MSENLGVYVHFPWCRSLCPYCDFPVAVAGRDPIPHRAYTDAVLAEMAERAGDFAGRKLVSIYFGGGTPSLWRTDCVARVIDEVSARWSRAPGDLEITVEANPVDCTGARLAAWRAAGVGRLSIGVQSTDPDELIALGRDHRMGDGVRAVEAALHAGFPRLSADVIFGVPLAGESAGESVRPGSASVRPGRPGRGPRTAAAERLADTGIGHLSVYELTIEDRTRFGRRAREGTLVPLSDDILADAYLAVHHALTGRGYEHYEVSSYARPGHRAVHNPLYWHGGEYLGLGNGAASFRRLPGGGAERVHNHRPVKRYLAAAGADRVASRDVLSAREVAVDRIWLAMRTSDGAPESWFADRADTVEWLLSGDLAELRSGRICPTLKGFLFCDRIASRLLGR